MAEKISFLMECYRDWNITKTIWYQPVYLISPFEKNLLNIFMDREFTSDNERTIRIQLEQIQKLNNNLLTCREN